MTFNPASAFLSGGVKGHMRTFCEGEPGNEGTKTGSNQTHAEKSREILTSYWAEVSEPGE